MHEGTGLIIMVTCAILKSRGEERHRRFTHTESSDRWLQFVCDSAGSLPRMMYLFLGTLTIYGYIKQQLVPQPTGYT